MIVGKITAKSQTTVPKAVRIALGLEPGDELAWEIEGDEVVVRRVAASQSEQWNRLNDFATFTEWATEADCQAYDRL